MVKFVESELECLKKEIVEMWTLVYNQLSRSCESVLTLNKELAQQVVMREKRVNVFELKIDSDIEDIIALYNPVAIDLRFVLAMMKINTNLERIGDFAEGLAYFVINYPEATMNGDLVKKLRLQEMTEEIKSMMNNALEALTNENTELATSVFLQDNFVDEVNMDAIPILANYLEDNPHSAKACLSLVSVFRKLERTGDHINNMVEEIVFYIDAKVLKHQKNEEEMIS